MAGSDRFKRYRARLKERAFTAIGFTCVFCGDREVQAAHVRATKLRGCGRGLDRRYRDVLKHPGHYRPMCAKHHRAFDRIMRELANTEPAETCQEPIPF
jgi:hypothetical protein